MLIHIENATIHPMHVISVVSVTGGCNVKTLAMDEFDFHISREDFNSLWLDALTWWSVKPPTIQKFSPEMQSLVDRTARRTKGE